MPVAALNIAKDLGLTAPPVVPVPAIVPASSPTYVPAVDPVPPQPIGATPPGGQFRGEGGTPFGSVPRIYITPRMALGELDTGYAPPGNDAYNPQSKVENPPDVVARPGFFQTMPVPVSKGPAKPYVGPVPTNAVVPPPAGPIAGQVFGFDLAKVPLWAWLVGAAFLGAKVLK